MDHTLIFAIAASGIFLLFALVKIASCLARRETVSVKFAKCLTYPYFLGRHHAIGPWTRCEFLLHLLYVAANAVLLGVPSPSAPSVSQRAGTLSVVNMVFLFTGMHPAFYPDLLGITLRTRRGFHRAAGWAVAALSVVHACSLTDRADFPLGIPANLWAVIGAISLGGLPLLFIPAFRKFAYEASLRAHQATACLCVYAIWSHLPPDWPSDRLYMLYLYVALRIFAVSWWSWAQSHPFTVVSWSKGKQDAVELVIQPRRGLTADLLRLTDTEPGSSFTLPAYVSGPHGVSESVERYTTVLMVASGPGIAAMIPYIKRLIHGFNARTCRACRVHFVWQLRTSYTAMVMHEWLGQLLEEDVSNNSYILSISIYLETEKMLSEKLPFGSHERIIVYTGPADLPAIVQKEVSGQHIQRLPNFEDERGDTLVMASVSDSLRDRLRTIVHGYLDEKVRLSELEFQPGRFD
ncbi:uncharacterized protein GIQ15_04317 [Arthroderma uncinatum]|uniref:uncharacterized protein n=1 Tax=Arthroderma uncinatum TaxID=74035 RepID=UPI00144AFA0F|nr:uncharacterized protein GIQ15_04317 [Arthroderma uncinatum]KAF3481558.1 hypothetical protein GIQ15_04317 [Arthroderma uncinatum]